MSDAKKAALTIIAGMPKPSSDESMPELPQLMAELGAALKADDFEGAASAFKAAMNCEYGASDEEE